MKNSRLFQILYLLMERQDVTAAWLSEKLEVSQRTIYRDIDALSAAGIPIYCQKGKGGGIRLMEQFQINRSLLDEEDQSQLLTALKSMEAVGAFGNTELISRLSALFKQEPTDWLEISFDSWGDRPVEQTCFKQCRQAIFDRRLLSFTYSNSQGQNAERIVEPIRLCYKGGNWYLYAYCRQKEDFRLFRLTRIQSLLCLKETFSPRVLPKESPGPDSSPQSPLSPDPKKVPMIPVTICFSRTASYQVMDYFLPEEIESGEDGFIIVKTAFPPGRWILNFLLSFGKEARVLEPDWLKRQLQKEAEKILKMYPSPL